MLTKNLRLKKYSAFIATYKLNNKVADENICIYFGKEKQDDELNTKFAFVVSKKIHKRAVVRNRIKRLMRESVRLLIKNNQIDNIYKYMSVICMGRPGAVSADFEKINRSMIDLLQKK